MADPIARADSGTHEISLTFDEPMEASTAEDVLNYTLLEAGRTGAFDDGDDVLIGITELAIAETELSATLTVNSGTTLPAGFYRLTVSDALQDKAGNALDGNGDGAPGGEFVLVFGLASPRAAAYLHVYRAMDQVGYVSATPRRAVPLLARSYTPATTTDPFDVQNGAVATVYDNSLAILALLLRGRPEDLARARTLADALTYAQENDTSPAPADWPHNPAPFEGHRLRDAYASGDIVDEHGAFRLPGWWDAQAEQWMMHGLALSFRTGDLAWATLALARAHEMLGDPDYLDAAEAMASWAGANCTRPGNGVGAGYSGGWIWDWGTTAWQESGTSIEHNADLAAAFTALHEITGNDSWQQHAAHAREFVLAMWDADNGYFHTGVALDGSAETVETTDAQALSAMLLESPPYWDALSRAAANTSLGAASRQRGEGVLFDFDSDLDGAWYEGTSQMAVAFSRANDSARAAATLGALRSAQITAAHANGRGMPAADTYGLTTGFGWQYHNRLSLSSTTWFIFAERRYNPLRNRWFTGVSLRPGWNLVSIPTPCSTPVDELFTDADGQSLKSGQTHWWDPVNNCYQDLLGDAPLQAQLGCWAFAQEPGKTGGIPGLSALDPILLTIGWNVVGPTSSCLLPASAKDLIDETVWVWDAAALRYRPLGATERLEPGCAYWVYAFSAGELHLRE